MSESSSHGLRRASVFRGCLSTLTMSLVLLAGGAARAQIVQHFDRTLGGSADENSGGIWGVVVPTADGGCLVGGSSASGAEFDKSEPCRGGFDYWIVKLDASGNKQWDRTFGGAGRDALDAALQTPDGGYVLVGDSTSDTGGEKTEPSRGSSDYWIVRIDSQGNVLWDKTIGGPGQDWPRDIIATNDGGFIVTGMGGTGVGGEKTIPSFGGYAGWDYWVVKIDGDGNKVWEQLFGTDGSDIHPSVVQLLDGTYLLGGHTSGSVSGSKTMPSRGSWDHWVVAMDANGQKLWDRTYGGAGPDVVTTMVATLDGGFAIAGPSASDVSGEKSEPSRGGYDYWIVKADAAGNEQWDRTLGSAVNESQYRGVLVQAPDGGFIVGGESPGGMSGDRTERNRGVSDYWIARLDGTGRKLWDRAIGGPAIDQLFEIVVAADGGYLLAGNSASNAGGEKSEPSRGSRDLWVVKVFEQSALTPSVSGMSYVDVDGDCNFDPMIDSPLANRLVEATPGPFFAQSGGDGQFLLRLPSGSYSIAQPNPTAGPYPQTCPDPAATLPVTAVSGTLTSAGGFGNKNPTSDLVTLSNIGVYPTPATSPCWGVTNEECVTFSNDGPACVHPTYSITVDGGISGAQVTGVSATPSCNCTPTFMGNVVTCASGASLPANADCTICATVAIPPWPMGPPPAGVSLTLTSSITGTVQGHPYTANGTFADPIICAYDPNDRTLLRPRECGDAGFIPAGEALAYRTRFQNLGNGPAHNVVVEETLDENLDRATFEVLGSSKNLTRAEIFPGNRLVLSFIGVELPPADVDPLGSIGTIVYSIRPKVGSTKPLPIRTQAAIFFDLNAPVITNETLHTVVDSLPPVSFDAPLDVCLTDAPFTLVGGSPAGGSYSIDGAAADVFDPAAIGAGSHLVRYSHTATVPEPIYTVNQVGTFAPVAGSGTTFTLPDDKVSDPLPIGFTFSFYGHDYTELRVSSNGFVTFNDSTAHGCCAGAVMPSVQAAPSNLIAFAWDDLAAGSFDAFTTGAAPNRVFVLHAIGRAQVLLYEGTNVIEIHTFQATSINGMTMGIQNDGGTLATVVPGRNGAVFSLANDFVQFIPPANAQFCSDERAQTITVHSPPVPSIVADGPTSLCPGETVTLVASGGVSHVWSTGASGPTLVVASGGTYSVEVTDEHGCSATLDATVTEVNADALGLACITGSPGECAAGTTACALGDVVCIQNVQPTAEVCDGVDNDCDGQVDEDAGCEGTGGGGAGGAAGSGGGNGGSGAFGGAGGSATGTGGAGGSATGTGGGGSGSGASGGFGDGGAEWDGEITGSSCGCTIPGVPMGDGTWTALGLLSGWALARRRGRTRVP